MGKATKTKTKIKAAPMHPLVRQADIPAAQRARRSYDVVRLAEDPSGDVIVRGQMRQHKAVRIKPAFREMYERKTFDKARRDGKPVSAKQIMAALEWFDERLDLAQSGMVRCGLDVSGAAGGSGSVGIAISQAAMEARSEVSWVRSLLTPALLAVFEAVMVDGERFIETARRLHAHQHVRLSVERSRRNLAAQFIEAACILAEAYGDRFLARDTGRIRTARYDDDARN